MRAVHRTVVLVLSLAAITAGCSSTDDLPPLPAPPATSAADRGDILVPRQGVLLGHYYGGAGSIEETDARIGRKPAIHLSYYDWSTDWATSAATRADLADGRIPLINWEPFGVSFDDIVGGKLDGTIEAQADSAKALGKKVLLDFAAEMNEEAGWGDHSPDKYVAAYRRVHEIFVRRGAENVVWIWCPNNTDSPNTPPAMSYYPGDGYVDWTGVDGYNWGTAKEGFSWQSFEEVFATAYGKLSALGKPIIIGEMASDEVGGSKAQWINEVAPTLRQRFPLIKAAVWFDVDKERRWQVNSSPSSLAAYRDLAKDPYFNPRG